MSRNSSVAARVEDVTRMPKFFFLYFYHLRYFMEQSFVQTWFDIISSAGAAYLFHQQVEVMQRAISESPATITSCHLMRALLRGLA